ncbi:UNVERIFIED_CONTAM: Ferruginol synthase [Sesamum radiatum]|uniref:Ferruginol synthase n=1 Tax=Sesamum radiatum TaxID=300843 RepID=A0AAW2QEU1_SESRA
MSLQLGSIYTVVVSSPELAREVLQKHDQVFSGRTIAAAAQVHDHHKISMAYLPVGKEWQTIRKICKEQMFSTHRLDASQGLRREKLQKLCDYVCRCCISGRVVNELKETIEGVAKIVGAPNLADFFPVLKKIDPQGIQRQAKYYFGRLLGMFEEIINQRLQSRKAPDGSPKKKDLLEALLDLSQGREYELSCKQINHLLVDLFVAGSDTTSSTVEWAMTELLLSPEKMAKAKNELKSVIGENKQVEESDISRLPYLQAVVKEIFRYHPAGPLLIPRKAEDDVEINGYMIPKNTQIFVNAWAIGRDPSIWSNPSSFEPKRFLDSNIRFKGQDFMLIPFGSGRRMCPGWLLSDRMLHLMVASLIHNFGWKFEPGVKPKDVDTEEKFGLSLHKLIPLKAIPVKPLSI